MHILAEGSTPYEIAQSSSKKYRLSCALLAANLVGKSPEALPKMLDLLDVPQPVVRYWAVVAIGALNSEAAPAAEKLTEMLEDSSPNVRFAAAGTLCKLDMCEKALPVLAKGLEDGRETVVLHAAREIQGIGNKARPIVEQIKKAQARCKNSDGGYKNNNHAMFIDWALKYALQNCRE